MFLFKKNLPRSVILGVLALAALCYALLSILEVPVYDVLLLVGSGIVIVAVLGLAGSLFGLLIHLVRSRLGSRKRGNAGNTPAEDNHANPLD